MPQRHTHAAGILAVTVALLLTSAASVSPHGTHVGTPGHHVGGKLYCSAETGTPVTVTAPEVGPIRNVVGERVWWSYALAWYNASAGAWQWLEAPAAWLEYRSYQASGQNQFWDNPVARVVGRSFYFVVYYWIYWDTAAQVQLLPSAEAWQGVNNTGWAGGPNSVWCRT